VSRESADLRSSLLNTRSDLCSLLLPVSDRALVHALPAVASTRPDLSSPILVSGTLLLSLAPTACGGGAASQPPSPSALASRLGCTGFSSTSPMLFAREEGNTPSKVTISTS
jgi:hypothetical protein